MHQRGKRYVRDAALPKCKFSRRSAARTVADISEFPHTWKVRESQGINLVRESQGLLLVVTQGILVACERKRRFLSTFQGKVATR